MYIYIYILCSTEKVILLSLSAEFWGWLSAQLSATPFRRSFRKLSATPFRKLSATAFRNTFA